MDRRKLHLRGVPLDMRRRDETGLLSLKADTDEFDREMRRLGLQPDPALLALPAPEGWSGPAPEGSGPAPECQALALLASGALTGAAKPLALPAPAGWAPTLTEEVLKQRRLPLAPIDAAKRRRF
jgi:hypothetical protein